MTFQPSSQKLMNGNRQRTEHFINLIETKLMWHYTPLLIKIQGAFEGLEMACLSYLDFSQGESVFSPVNDTPRRVPTIQNSVQTPLELKELRISFVVILFPRRGVPLVRPWILGLSPRMTFSINPGFKEFLEPRVVYTYCHCESASGRRGNLIPSSPFTHRGVAAMAKHGGRGLRRG
ncbi:hypothetical protein K9L27_01185 [Candidatus Gracilibacteria bacterium]|nr:hypothetical protein [Candidatus Gracilibacteria bacterium]